MNCWKLPLHTFKHASEYINKLFLYTSLFKSPVLIFWSFAPFIRKPRTCQQGVMA